MLLSIEIILDKKKLHMKSLRSIRASFKAYVVISLFVFHFARGSLNQTLVNIFSSKNNFNLHQEDLIDDSTATKALQDVGMELFKAISFNQPFDTSIDTFEFIKKIQDMDTCLIINKPKDFLRNGTKHFSQTDPYWQALAQNPLNANDQQEIIKMQKFLHLFTDDSVISSDAIAEKIGLKNYIFFHDHYVKYALKISILNRNQDTLLNTYSHCVDPYFKILASHDETVNDYRNVFWFDGFNSRNAFVRYNLGLLIYDLSTRNGDHYDRNLVNSLHSHINQDSSIAKTVQAPIHKLILSATHIQKYIRQGQAIGKYNKKKACQCLVTFIKRWSAYCTLETLRYEKNFKIDPSKVRVPELPSEIWNKILYFSVESMGSLILVNKLCKGLVSSAIDNLKDSFSKQLYNDPFIQEIQAMDRSLVFDSRSYCLLTALPFNRKRRKKYVFKMIETPLNCTDRKKIKIIRQFLSAINTRKIPSNEIAHELGLKNYGFFYDQYFSYAIKILAYESLLNSSQYYKKYLECLDHTFEVELTEYFIEEPLRDCSNYLPNYPNNSESKNDFKLESAKEIYSINMRNVLKLKHTLLDKYGPLNKNHTIRSSLGDLLSFFKANRKYDIPDSVISCFQNPTYLKKKILLDTVAQQALVATQAFIRSYNAQNILNQYKDEKVITQIQSAARRFLIQNSWDNMRQQFALEKLFNSFNFDAEVKKCDDLITIFNDNSNRLLKETSDFEREAKFFVEQTDRAYATQKIEDAVKFYYSTIEKSKTLIINKGLMEMKKSIEALKKQDDKKRCSHIRRFLLIGSVLFSSFCLLYSGFLQKMFFSVV